MSEVRDIPITPTGPIPLGEPDTDAPAAPVLMATPTGRRTVGIARIRPGRDRLTAALEVTGDIAAALDFGSVIASSVATSGGDSDGHAIDGWALHEIEIARRTVTCAVRREGWSEMPIAPRDREWDAAAADQRISEACGIGGDDPDWDCYGSAFLYRDEDADPDTKGAYKMGIVDIIDGTRSIVPRGAFAAAGVLQGSRGGVDAPADQIDQMRSVLDGVYERMADQFDDETIVPPWSESES